MEFAAPIDATTRGYFRSDDARRADRPELLSHCRDVTCAGIAKTLAAIVAQVEGDLLRRSDTALAISDRRILLDAMVHFRTYREQLAVEFERRFTTTFDDLVGAQVNAEPPADDGMVSVLSLLDDDTLAERLILSEISRQAKNALEVSELFGIRMRFAELLATDVDDESKNPLGAECIYGALLAACECIPAAAAEKHALLYALQPYVTREINEIYVSLNNYLLGHNIAPAIRRLTTTQDPSRNGVVQSDSISASLWAAPNNSVQTGDGGTAGAAVTGGAGVARPGDRAIALLVGQLPEARATLVTALTGILQGPADHKRLVARMLTHPSDHDFEQALEIPATPHLISALGEIQERAAAHPSDPPPAVTLDATLRDQSHPLDVLTIEFVALVFEGFALDEELPAGVKAQIARLHIVAIKAALLDRSFFASRNHPMRRLLDRIAAIATDVEVAADDDSEFLHGLAQIVDGLVAEFTNELSRFSEASQALELLLERCRAPIELAVAALLPEVVAREREEAIRTTALAEIRRRITPRVPTFARAFLITWWLHALAESHGREEPAEDAWRYRLEVVDLLAWSVSPVSSAEVKKLALMVPRIMRDLTRGMKAADMPELERKQFFDALMNAHTGSIDRAKARSTAAAELATRNAAQDEAPEAQRPTEPLPDDFDRLISDLPRGTVVEIAGTAGRQQLKLSWVSPTRKTFLFASHAVRAHAVPAFSLADALREGRARIVPVASSTPLDRILQRITGAA
ncbi:MAG: DUF1631 family protein [Burkholderiales bacterium]